MNKYNEASENKDETCGECDKCVIQRYNSMSGSEGMREIASLTLEGDSALRERIQQPHDYSLDTYDFSCVFRCRWIYVNLLSFVDIIEMLYDSYGKS